MRKSLALALVLLFAVTANVYAVGEARLIGKVIDQDGKPLEGASVTLVALSGKTLKKTFKTDAKGEYAVFVLDGTLRYEFTWEKEGYSSYKEPMKLKLVPEKNIKDVTLVKGAIAPAAAATLQPAAADPAVTAYNEGVKLVNSGDTAGAIAKFEEAVTANPELTAGHIALAKVYSKTEKWAQAIAAAEKVVAIDPDDSAMNSILAVAYAKTGNAAKAAEYKSKAPADPRALYNDAAKLINAGKQTEAEPLLRKAVAADPEFAQAHYELGMLLAGMSKNADARVHLQKYLDLEPNGKDAAMAKEMLNYVK